jgi:hypothetical protein
MNPTVELPIKGGLSDLLIKDTHPIPIFSEGFRIVGCRNGCQSSSNKMNRPAIGISLARSMSVIGSQSSNDS